MDMPTPWVTGPPPKTGDYLVCYRDFLQHGREYMRLVRVSVCPPADHPFGRDADGLERHYSHHFGDLGVVGEVLGWCEPTGANFELALADILRRFNDADRRGRARAAKLREAT